MVKKIALKIGAAVLASSYLFMPQIIPLSNRSNPPNLEEKVAIGISNQTKKYALLISGGGNKRYQENIDEMVRVLTENKYGQDQIFIANEAIDSIYYGSYDLLKYPGQHFIPSYTAKQKNIVSPTKDNIRGLISKIKSLVTDRDFFLVYLTGHGGYGTEDNYVVLKNQERLNTSELDSYLNSISPKLFILIADQCFSGGFMKLGRGNYVAITGAKNDELTFEREFISGFIKSHKQKKESDLNNDGVISLYESFSYAKKSCNSCMRGISTPQFKKSRNVDKNVSF
ncbi:MAG TPA: hypothetical protein VI564_03340 [Candidatus Nanoarchaeia archaeon]|nr:hypothetical protein [Candidatus Nanoarchaeia archaeon]